MRRAYRSEWRSRQRLRRRGTCLAAGFVFCGLQALSADGLSAAQSPASAEAPATAARELLQKGTEALDARRFTEAVRVLEQAAALAPRDIEIFFHLGRAYWGEDRPYGLSPEKAAAAFERAVALDPDADHPVGFQALEQLVVVYLRHARMPEAKAVYERLLARETRPDRLDKIRTQLGEIALDLGTFVPDELTILNASDEVLGPIGPLFMRTSQNFEKGRHTQDPIEEERYYRLATVTDPMMYQAYNNWGVALIHQGRYREAVLPLRKADVVWRMRFPLSPVYQRAHVWLLLCYLELGDLEAAAQEVAILSRFEEYDHFGALFQLRFLIAIGRAQETLPSLEEAARDDPEHVDVLDALASAYASVGRYEDAAATLRRLLAVAPPGHPYLRHRFAGWRAGIERLETSARAR